MAIITLTTDFGLADGYAGIMKGVILSIAPAAQLVDLSHNIPPQDIQLAAYLLAQATPYFPTGAIHLAVVDPGVGSARRPLIVQTRQAYFVGPDNGLFDAALAGEGVRAFVADRPEFWLPVVSRTFHGRDVFAPLAAHLALGVAPERLGTPIADPVRLAQAAPQRLRGGAIRGQVVAVDHFGNLITNVPGDWLAGHGWQCRVAGHTIPGLSLTYADVSPGSLAALVSSGNTLEIAVRNGSAARLLEVGPGAIVELLASKT